MTIVLKKLYKNTNWKVLNTYMQKNSSRIESINSMTNLNNFISKLTKIVLKNIELLILIAKDSQYNKR